MISFRQVSNCQAWVRDNDLFVTIGGNTEIQVTNDGSKNVMNGIADWVYEGALLLIISADSFVSEEVLASQTAMWFSPGGTALAYLKLDETKVKEYTYPLYEKGSENSYPQTVIVKYPKVFISAFIVINKLMGSPVARIRSFHCISCQFSRITSQALTYSSKKKIYSNPTTLLLPKYYGCLSPFYWQDL